MPTNKELQIQLEALITRVASLEATNADLKKELETIKTARSGSTWANTLFKSNVKPAVEMTNVVSAAKIEIKDQAKKSANLLVFGLPLSKAEDEAKRSADDISRVSAILQATAAPVGSIGFTATRFKSSCTSKPPPLLIKLKSVNVNDTIKIILKHASKLQGSSWSNVFLAPDLTLLEREYGRRLRKERDDMNIRRSESEKATFRYGIRGNQVVKVKL